MKKHSKVGNRPGKPTYRTPALFRHRQYLKVQKSRFRSSKESK